MKDNRMFQLTQIKLSALSMAIEATNGEEFDKKPDIVELAKLFEEYLCEGMEIIEVDTGQQATGLSLVPDDDDGFVH
jgi:hypothetical protein